MEFEWKITAEDIAKVKNAVATSPSLKIGQRTSKNIMREGIALDKNTILHTMMMCLLTTQQDSSDNGRVSKFLNITPFPVCMEALTGKDPKEFIAAVLLEHKLQQRKFKIPEAFDVNFKFLEETDWHLVEEIKAIGDEPTVAKERALADRIQENFFQFGPKQSRNFLQSLGITRYEIPIDSRAINWFGNFGFPITITTTLLGDVKFYHFLSDAIQLLCDKAGVFPCLFDAAIFDENVPKVRKKRKKKHTHKT